MDKYGESVDIPLNERFYAGGPTSVRGFGYQMLGPTDPDGDPLGGRFKIVGNIELRRTLFKIIGGALFVDVGNVWSRTDAFRLDDIRMAVGAGLRASSPLGIIRLDYGLNVDPRNNEPNAKIHLGMGQAF